jgi:hypothetical protein
MVIPLEVPFDGARSNSTALTVNGSLSPPQLVNYQLTAKLVMAAYKKAFLAFP